MREPKPLTIDDLYLVDECLTSVLNIFDNLGLDYPKKLDKIDNKIKKQITHLEKENGNDP